MTAIWPKGKPVIPATTWGRSWRQVSSSGPPVASLMTALAVAYQIQCRLCDAAPVRARGFDHTVQGAYAVAAGVSKILGLDPTTDRQRTRH